MIWEEILIDRPLADADIVAALARLFAVPPDRVRVVEDIAEVSVAPDTRVLCERMPVEGDFSSRLSIYLRDLDPGTGERGEKVGRLCRLLNCRCLMSDESLDPCSWLLVSGPRDIRPVRLDPERLEREQYVLEEVH